MKYPTNSDLKLSVPEGVSLEEVCHLQKGHIEKITSLVEELRCQYFLNKCANENCYRYMKEAQEIAKNPMKALEEQKKMLVEYHFEKQKELEKKISELKEEISKLKE